jgi:gamma-butyrobetaine dioxygenase
MTIPETASPPISLRAFPAAWLRDNCDCPRCRDPRNSQKLFQITDLPEGLAIGS